MLEENGELPPGTQVGEYVVDEKIGSGAFGEVYAAEHPVIGKRAAIKVLGSRFSNDPQTVTRFIGEAKAVNRIQHRNIIDIFAFGELEDGRHYLIMELLEGETLQELLRREGPLPLPRAWPILEGVARALDAAHSAGVVHRDLKPDNIFVVRQRDGQVTAKLLDFGIAKLVAKDSLAAVNLTRTGVAMGTPLYMAPEQCRGTQIDHRVDLYAFGIVVYETLAGAVPFDGDSAVEVLYKHINDEPPPLSQVAALPPPLDAPIAKLMRKRPSSRPPSATTAVQAIADAATASGIDVASPDSTLRYASPMPVSGAVEVVSTEASVDLPGPPPSAAPARTQQAMAQTQAAPTGRSGLHWVFMAAIALMGLLPVAFMMHEQRRSVVLKPMTPVALASVGAHAIPLDPSATTAPEPPPAVPEPAPKPASEKPAPQPKKVMPRPSPVAPRAPMRTYPKTPGPKPAPNDFLDER